MLRLNHYSVINKTVRREREREGERGTEREREREREREVISLGYSYTNTCILHLQHDIHKYIYVAN